MATLETTDTSFEKDIETGITLVDFWAVWCQPCQVMIPRLDELATKLGDKAKIMKMNVDQNQKTPEKFRVMSIPTMIIFKDGQPVKQFVGIREVEDLEKEILEYTE